MEAEIRKRLEEAANNICSCAGCPATIIGGGCKKKCVMHEFFIKGGEWMFKECGGMTVLHELWEEQK